MRVVHFLNQFLWRLGGEEEAGAAPLTKMAQLGRKGYWSRCWGKALIWCGPSSAATTTPRRTWTG